MQQAYDFFNRALFADRLPTFLITYQRKNRTYGYFSGDRWSGGRKVVDEIAMNPMHFQDRTQHEVLSTLVHEMAHLEQHHFGKLNRPGLISASSAMGNPRQIKSSAEINAHCARPVCVRALADNAAPPWRAWSPTVSSVLGCPRHRPYHRA